jgi:hypothetical protein
VRLLLFISVNLCKFWNSVNTQQPYRMGIISHILEPDIYHTYPTLYPILERLQFLGYFDFLLLLNRDDVNLYGGFQARGTHLHFDEEPVVKILTFSLFPEI